MVLCEILVVVPVPGVGAWRIGSLRRRGRVRVTPSLVVPSVRVGMLRNLPAGGMRPGATFVVCSDGRLGPSDHTTECLAAAGPPWAALWCQLKSSSMCGRACRGYMACAPPLVFVCSVRDRSGYGTSTGLTGGAAGSGESGC